MPWPCGQQVAETVSAGAELCTPTRHTYAHTTTQALVSVVTDADQWGGTSSIGFWQSDDRVAMFTNRQLWLQNDMLWNQPPGFLVSEMPDDPSKHWDQAACSVAEKWVFVKDLLSRHRGDVREISGDWVEVPKPFPEEDRFHHTQFCWTDALSKARTLPRASPAKEVE